MPYSSLCHTTLCPTRPRITALYALLVPVSPHSMPYSSPCPRTLCPTRPRVPALYALLVPVSQHSMPYSSPCSMPYSCPCHSTLCPTHQHISQHLISISSSAPCVHPPFHNTLCPTLTALHLLLFTKCACPTSHNTLCPSGMLPILYVSSHPVCAPRLTTLCALQLYIYIFTNCAPQVSQQMVPHSGTSSTSSQTAPHRSHNKWCPTVVPHLHLHKLHPTGLTTNGAPQWYLIYTSTNWVYPTCLTTKLCTPHVSQNSVYPTCLTTKLCVPHTSHNKTMYTPHVSQQNYVYPTCLTTKLCVLHTSDKNLGPTVVLHSSRSHHTLCVCAFADSESSFPAPSSKLCHNWLRHWRDSLYLHASVHRQSAPSKKNMRCIHLWLKILFHLDSNNFAFVGAGVSSVGGHKRNTWYNWSCL